MEFQRRLGARKTKIPSTKHQIPNKFQVPNSNDLNEGAQSICCQYREIGQSFHKRVHLLFVLVIWTLEIGAYLEFGAWKLVLQSYPLLKVILDRSVVVVIVKAIN